MRGRPDNNRPQRAAQTPQHSGMDKLKQIAAENKAKEKAEKKRAAQQRAAQQRAAKQRAAQQKAAQQQAQRRAAQQRTAKPQSAAQREADRRIAKAQQERSATAPKRQRRGSNVLYYALALIFAAIVLVILAHTVLFNVDTVLVEGNVSYSYEDIVAAGAVPMGENLMYLDTKSIGDRVVASLNYIDIAEVKKVFPTSVKITVQEAEEWFCVKQGRGAATISRNGKIIDDKAKAGLPIVFGYTVEKLIVGEQLVSIGESKQNIPGDILNAADEAGFEGFIKQIDMEDRFSIILSCENDIIIKLGTSRDLEQKFEVVNAIFAENEGLTDMTISVVNPAVGYMHRNDSVIMPEIKDESAETAESSDTAEEE